VLDAVVEEQPAVLGVQRRRPDPDPDRDEVGRPSPGTPRSVRRKSAAKAPIPQARGG